MTTFLGEIRLWAGSFVPEGWMACDGRELPIQDYGSLYAVLGNAFGGTERTFRVPDLRGRVPVSHGTRERAPSYAMGSHGGAERVSLTKEQRPAHSHQVIAAASAPDSPRPAGAFPAKGPRAYGQGGTDLPMSPAAVGESGAGDEHENRQPYLALQAIIAIKGADPASPPRPAWEDRPGAHERRGALIGEVRVFPYVDGKVPAGWFACDGRTLPGRLNVQLFSVIGKAFGGTNIEFKLPNLAGRVALGVGRADDKSTSYAVGDRGGERTVTLEPRHNAKHTHELQAGSTSGGTDPAMRRWGSSPGAYVSPPANLTALHPEVVEATGGEPHPNEMPYLALTYAICHTGVFPTPG